MSGPETNGWSARVYVVPVVVVVGHVQLAGVFGGVRIRVPDEGSFPLGRISVTHTTVVTFVERSRLA